MLMKVQRTSISYYAEIIAIGIVSWLAAVTWSQVFLSSKIYKDTSIWGKFGVASVVTIFAIVALVLSFGDDEEKYEIAKSMKVPTTWKEKKEREQKDQIDIFGKNPIIY